MRPIKEKQATALRRYKANADVARRSFLRYINEHPGDYGRGDLKHVEMFAHLSLWYCTLYVLDEALQRLRVEDERLDAMRRHELHGALGKFRNATFH